MVNGEICRSHWYAPDMLSREIANPRSLNRYALNKLATLTDRRLLRCAGFQTANLNYADPRYAP